MGKDPQQKRKNVTTIKSKKCHGFEGRRVGQYEAGERLESKSDTTRKKKVIT